MNILTGYKIKLTRNLDTHMAQWEDVGYEEIITHFYLYVKFPIID